MTPMNPKRPATTTQGVRRRQRLAASLLAVSAVVAIAGAGTSSAHAATSERPSHTGAKSAESNDAVARRFENVTFTNKTTTPLHFRASLPHGNYHTFNVEVGQRIVVDHKGMVGLEIFAGRDAKSPHWASFSNLATYLDDGPAKTGYLWAKGNIWDPDSDATAGFKVTTGATQTLEFERKTFSVSFSQETTSHMWVPRAELTFGGTR
mgnify:FL=1